MSVLRHAFGNWLVRPLAITALVVQIAPVFGQENASDTTQSATAVLKKFTEVNEIWLSPKVEQLSYVITGTIKEEPRFASRVWIDGQKIRWEMDPLGSRPSTYAVVFRGDSAVYVKGSEQLLNTKRATGDLHPFRQGITWRTAVHAIRENGAPSDAKLLERKEVDGGELVIVEVTIPDRRRVGLGLQDSWLGYSGEAGAPATVLSSKVRLHMRLPEYSPILEEYPDRDVRFRYGEPIRFDDRLAPSSITYEAKSSDGKTWELAAHFQKYESLWLLQMAKNRQNGVVVAALEVSDVSTAPPEKALFDVPAK